MYDKHYVMDLISLKQLPFSRTLVLFHFIFVCLASSYTLETGPQDNRRKTEITSVAYLSFYSTVALLTIINDL